MSFGLRQNTVQKLQLLFSKYERVEKVIIYGSRAKGNYREGSDIDLVLKGESLSTNLILTIQNELDELLLPYKVDLSIEAQITNEDLKDHIKRVGKLFYKREPKGEDKT